MKEAFKTILHDKSILTSFLLGLVVLIAAVIYSIVAYSHLPPLVPIYNRLPWGYARLGSKIELYIPVGAALFFFILNLFVAAFLYKKAILISRIIGASSLTIALCTSIYLVKIIQLVL